MASMKLKDVIDLMELGQMDIDVRFLGYLNPVVYDLGAVSNLYTLGKTLLDATVCLARVQNSEFDRVLSVDFTLTEESENDENIIKTLEAMPRNIDLSNCDSAFCKWFGNKLLHERMATDLMDDDEF